MTPSPESLGNGRREGEGDLEKGNPPALGCINNISQQYFSLELPKKRFFPDADDINKLVCLSVWTSRAME